MTPDRTAQAIVRRYINLCRAHGYEPAQTLVLEQWIADAIRDLAEAVRESRKEPDNEYDD